MPSDIAVLEQLNIDVGAAEDRVDGVWLDGVLAPKLAFRRANGLIVDRGEYLTPYLNGTAPKRNSETQVEHIHLYGDRAIVTCIVTVKNASGDQRFHNVRLWVRHEGEWKLLGWANEQPA